MSRGRSIVRVYLMRMGGYMLPADSVPMNRPRAVELARRFEAQGFRVDILSSGERRTDEEWSALHDTPKENQAA